MPIFPFRSMQGTAGNSVLERLLFPIVTGKSQRRRCRTGLPDKPIKSDRKAAFGVHVDRVFENMRQF